MAGEQVGLEVVGDAAQGALPVQHGEGGRGEAQPLAAAFEHGLLPRPESEEALPVSGAERGALLGAEHPLRRARAPGAAGALHIHAHLSPVQGQHGQLSPVGEAEARAAGEEGLAMGAVGEGGVPQKAAQQHPPGQGAEEGVLRGLAEGQGAALSAYKRERLLPVGGEGADIETIDLHAFSRPPAGSGRALAGT